MDSLTSFKAVYCSGIYVPEAATVSALSLLFERVYLPRNWALIEEFAKKYEFVGKPRSFEELFEQIDPKGRLKAVTWKQSDGSEPFPGLTPSQKQTGFLYFLRGHQFA